MTRKLSRDTANLLTAASVFADALLPERHPVLRSVHELRDFLSPRAEVSTRDVEMVRLAAAVLDGSHALDPQTIASVSADLARELRGLARAHCAHERVTAGRCQHCDAAVTIKTFGAGGVSNEAPMVGTRDADGFGSAAGSGPVDARGDAP